MAAAVGPQSRAVVVAHPVAIGVGEAGAAGAAVAADAVAVSALADTACIIVAEGLDVDADAVVKAREQDIPVLRTPLPIFEAAKRIDKALS